MRHGNAAQPYTQRDHRSNVVALRIRTERRTSRKGDTFAGKRGSIDTQDCRVNVDRS